MSVALWKALYTQGHDAAALFSTSAGWRLEGNAVFAKEGAPARLSYALDLATDFSTLAGSIEGMVGVSPVWIAIRRDLAGWTLNGVRQREVEGLLDLDFGFTPATNHPQLRRMDLAVGQSKEITVAWMDVDSDRLMPLPQNYRRIAHQAYDYHSPQGPYHATLKIADNGFVASYPTLWEMESGS